MYEIKGQTLFHNDKSIGMITGNGLTLEVLMDLLNKDYLNSFREMVMHATLDTPAQKASLQRCKMLFYSDFTLVDDSIRDAMIQQEMIEDSIHNQKKPWLVANGLMIRFLFFKAGDLAITLIGEPELMLEEAEKIIRAWNTFILISSPWFALILNMNEDDYEYTIERLPVIRKLMMTREEWKSFAEGIVP